MNNRLSEASFRQKLDSMSKNIIRNQNPLKLVFKDISIFEAENPLIDFLLEEIDIRKKYVFSKISLKAPKLRDIQLRARLDKLRSFKNNTNNNNNNNNKEHFPPQQPTPSPP